VASQVSEAPSRPSRWALIADDMVSKQQSRPSRPRPDLTHCSNMWRVSKSNLAWNSCCLCWLVYMDEGAEKSGCLFSGGCSSHDAQHITAILGESVVFNCNVDFPNEQPVPYVLQWEKKVGEVSCHFTSSISSVCWQLLPKTGRFTWPVLQRFFVNRLP